MDEREIKELKEDILDLEKSVEDSAKEVATAIENLMDDKILLADAQKKLRDYQMEQLGKRLGL